MNYLTAFGRSFVAETHKTRHTLALWSTILAPLVIVIFTFISGLYQFEGVKAFPGNPWLAYARTAYIVSTLLLLPMYIALLTYLLNFIEHKNEGWKYLYVQPIHRSAVFYAKAVYALALFTICMAAMLVLFVLSGYLLQVFRPGMNFTAVSFLPTLGKATLYIYIACFAIFSFQYVASMLLRSFFVPISIAVLGTVFTGMAMAWQHVDKVFIAYPTITVLKLFSVASEGPARGPLPDYDYLFYGIGISIVILAAGEYLIRRRVTY